MSGTQAVIDITGLSKGYATRRVYMKFSSWEKSDFNAMRAGKSFASRQNIF
jgi:hypothetical protein